MYHNFNLPHRIKHSNVCLNIQLFKEQLTYMKKYYNIISLEQLISHLKLKTKLPPNPIVLTFDDGYLNNYTLAYPILSNMNVHATIFLTTHFIDSEDWLWVNKLEYVLTETQKEQLEINIPGFGIHSYNLSLYDQKMDAYNNLKSILKSLKHNDLKICLAHIFSKLDVYIDSQTEPNYHMLSREQIKDMNDAHIDFGVHTSTHPILTNLDKEELYDEIVYPKRKLEKMIGRRVRYFAYPNGDYNEAVKRIVAHHYDAALSVNEGFVTLGSDLMALNRVAAKDDLVRFKWSLVRPTT